MCLYKLKNAFYWQAGRWEKSMEEKIKKNLVDCTSFS